jgi:hypothetical protein
MKGGPIEVSSGSGFLLEWLSLTSLLWTKDSGHSFFVPSHVSPLPFGISVQIRLDTADITVMSKTAHKSRRYIHEQEPITIKR